MAGDALDNATKFNGALCWTGHRNHDHHFFVNSYLCGEQAVFSKRPGPPAQVCI